VAMQIDHVLVTPATCTRSSFIVQLRLKPPIYAAVWKRWVVFRGIQVRLA